MLIGLLFLNPLVGLAVGAGTRAALGALSDIGINDQFLKELGETLPSSSATLFASTALAACGSSPCINSDYTVVSNGNNANNSHRDNAARSSGLTGGVSRTSVEVAATPISSLINAFSGGNQRCGAPALSTA